MGLLKTDEDDQKPLFRKYVTRLKRAGKNPNEIFDVVIKIRLSKSEEWIIIEGTESIALLNAESKVGQEFWLQVYKFIGLTLKGLLIVPASGKLGFDIEPSEQHQTDWEWSDFEECIYNTQAFMSRESNTKLKDKLSLENMTVTPNIRNAETRDSKPTTKRSRKDVQKGEEEA